MLAALGDRHNARLLDYTQPLAPQFAGMDVVIDQGGSAGTRDMGAPLLSLPNVVATPDMAGMTDGTSRRRAQCAADNVDRVAAGLEPLYRVA